MKRKLSWWLLFPLSYAHSFRPQALLLSQPTLLRSSPTSDDALLPLWKLASAHCASQALCTAIQLDIPLFLSSNDGASLDEIAAHVGGPSADELRRLLRLLTTVDILVEEIDQDNNIRFSLTPTGQLLVQEQGMAFGIQHWMEEPLWSSWLQVPSYLKEGPPFAFERANEGISSDYYYNQQDHPESLRMANRFVQWVHQQEVEAVVNGFDWSTLSHQRLVDVGGHYGTVLSAIVQKHPTIEAISLDLPGVIESAPNPPQGVQLVAGNALDSIPDCDAVLLKHFLDRCMWTVDETVRILKNCHAAAGTVVVAEAVLPNIGSSHEQPTALSMDALYMLVGREGQRTEAEWQSLAGKAGFRIQQINRTSVPSCSILVLEAV